MKVSEITIIDIKHHLRIDFADDDLYLATLLDTAKSYVQNYTGLSAVAIDEIKELSSVVLMIVCDLYENRGITGTSSYKTGDSINKIYDSMLSMHCINLV